MPPVEGDTATGTDSPERAGGDGRQRVVVWFAGVNWDDIPGTDRSLVEAMTRPVLWVDRGVPPWRQGVWRQVRHPAVRVLRNDPPLWRLTPIVPPFSTRVGLRRLTSLMIRWQTRWALRASRMQPAAVVLTHLAELFRGWPAGTPRVLYGTDDFVAGAGLMGLSSRWLEQLEDKCLREADLVFAVSVDLAEKWRQKGGEVRILPNGARVLPLSAKAWKEPLDDEAGTPIAAERSEGVPVVGLVGQLTARIDIRVLETLADAGLPLLLVGPVAPEWEPDRFAALCRRPLVQWTGRVPAAELPRHLARMDVGITPYVDSAFNRASFPLKTLEYLGAGLPAVVTDIPASRRLLDDLAQTFGPESASRHLAVATAPDLFVAYARRLGRKQSTPLRDERRRYAARHSWEARARELDEVLGSLCT